MASPSTAQLRAWQAVGQVDELLAPADGSGTVSVLAIFLAGPTVDIPLMSELFTRLRLTELGELWRDAGREVRNRQAQAKVLQWLVAKKATAEDPKYLREYPVRDRTADGHFFSQRDLMSALQRLEKAGYIRLQKGGISLSAWPTPSGISQAAEMPDMREDGISQGHRHLTVQIAGDISGSQINIGDGASQFVGTLIDPEELRAFLLTMRSVAPYMYLAPAPKAEFEQALEQATAEAAKESPDSGRLATALRTIGTVLMATGENVLANVLTAWLAKLGFPGLGG